MSMSQVALSPTPHHSFGAALHLLSSQRWQAQATLTKLGADRARLKHRAHHQVVTIRQDGPNEDGAFPLAA